MCSKLVLVCYDAMFLTSPLQVLVELADRQDHEVGDGTTSVVILAAELLKVSALGILGMDYA